MTVPRVIELVEYRPLRLPLDGFDEVAAAVLLRDCKSHFSIEYPTPKTNGEWEIKAEGIVGYVPLTNATHLRVLPKAPVSNLLRMMELAYDTRIEFARRAVADSNSLDDLFNSLARLLLERVEQRLRIGLYRNYRSDSDVLGLVRGRIRLRAHLQRPWKTKVPCEFDDHTYDLEDNQILVWTALCLARCAGLSESSRGRAARVFRALSHSVSVLPLTGNDCVGRHYHRLNDDYRNLHALCRFFLDRIGPTHTAGDRRSLPFIIDVAEVFERFVAKWLAANLPADLEAVPQEPHTTGDFDWSIDVVIRHRATREAVAVLDTKYKVPEKPSNADVAQVVTYAEMLDCDRAFLVYPTPFSRPAFGVIGRVEVGAADFDLANRDLDEAGNTLLQRLWLGAGART